jgi:hypothetical protein
MTIPPADEQNELAVASKFVQSLVDNRDSSVSRKSLLTFAGSRSLSVLGLLAYVANRTNLSARVIPPLSLDERQAILKAYWHRCIVENPADSEFVGNRYISAGEVLGWIRCLWDDKSANTERMADMKEWLASLYRDGNEGIKTCIVQGTLEHLFQNRAIRHYFKDWKEDKELRTAYQEAIGAGGLR